MKNQIAIQGLPSKDGYALGKSIDLKEGIYSVMEQDFGPRLFIPLKDDPEVELLVPDKTDPSHAIMGEISKFLESRPLYDKFKVMHKRGIVLYGPPGTGKTATLNMLSRLFVEKVGGWVLTNANEINLSDTVREIRNFDPTKPIMMVFDDISQRDVHPSLLSFMDGQEQISNIVFVFTTNYYATLPPALKRPSRTDLHFEIKGMTDAAAAGFCKAKFQDEDFKPVKAAFSKEKIAITYAVLKEVMLLRHVYGMEPANALKRIKKSGADFSPELNEEDED